MKKIVNKFVQFPYSVSDPSFDEFDNLPRLPLTLQHENKTVDVIGLVDSGATVNVLPYHLGIELGAVWIEQKATLRLAGNFGNSPAHPSDFCFSARWSFSPNKVSFCLDKDRKCSFDFGTN
jgi:hypothetical protein